MPVAKGSGSASFACRYHSVRAIVGALTAAITLLVNLGVAPTAFAVESSDPASPVGPVAIESDLEPEPSAEMAAAAAFMSDGAATSLPADEAGANETGATEFSETESSESDVIEGEVVVIADLPGAEDSVFILTDDGEATEVEPEILDQVAPGDRVAATVTEAGEVTDVEVIAFAAPAPRVSASNPVHNSVTVVMMTLPGTTVQPGATSQVTANLATARQYWDFESSSALLIDSVNVIDASGQLNSCAATSSDPWTTWNLAANIAGWPSSTLPNQHLMVVIPTGCGGPGAFGTVGSNISNGGRIMVYGNAYTPDTLAHEMGHNFGLAHANILDCPTGIVDQSFGPNNSLSSCQVNVYGDVLDVMGVSGKPNVGNLSAPSVDQLGFAINKQVISTPTSLTLNIVPLGSAAAANNVSAIEIIDPKSPGEHYWLEYRSPNTTYDQNDVNKLQWPSQVTSTRFVGNEGVRVVKPCQLTGDGACGSVVIPSGANLSFGVNSAPFTNVNGTIKVTVNALTADQATVTITVSFADVATSNFQTEINWLVANKITTGYADGGFHPSAIVTREAIASFFYKAAGSPNFTQPAYPTFSDVAGNSKFLTAIEWLSFKGITTGWNDGTTKLFKPANGLTRESAAAFFYRAAGSPSYTPPLTPTFNDVPTTSTFYKEVEWLATTGITTGYDDGGYHPGAQITRETIAAFLYRATQKGLLSPANG